MRKLMKLAMLVIAMLSVSLNANADFRFGIRAGVNVDKLNLDKETFDSSNRCGFTGGVMTEFTVPLIGIGADLSLMYTRMNSRLAPTTAADGTMEEHGRNFLEIPVNVKYKLTIPAISAIIKPYVFTGPSFAFKLGKSTINDMKTKTCQVAWNVGLGLELLKHVQVGASYGFGMNNVADLVVNAEKIKVKNKYWTITAAYLF